MRQSPTRPEARLWNLLRDRRFAGVKFRRQQPIGRYIVDFYCPTLQLVIELDGSQHQSAVLLDYENRRTRFLQARGIEVVRIANVELIRNPQHVYETVQLAIERRRGAC